MIRQIIFFVSINKEPRTETPVLFFDWDGNFPVMDSAFVRLEDFMKENYPNQEYQVNDWHWADKGR